VNTLIIAALLALGLAAPAAAQGCIGTMKPIAEIEAVGIAVMELAPMQRANVEANMKANPEAPNLTHVYVLAEDDTMMLVLVVGNDCVVFA